jgi:hypothetical protein
LQRNFVLYVVDGERLNSANRWEGEGKTEVLGWFDFMMHSFRGSLIVFCIPSRTSKTKDGDELVLFFEFPSSPMR